MIMDLLLFVIAKWASLMMDIDCPRIALNLVFLSMLSFAGPAALVNGDI